MRPSEPWVMGVALTAAVAAALAAVTALYAEHFATEATLEQIQASDRWNEFQANSIKEKVVERKKELLMILKNEPDPKDEDKLAEYKRKRKRAEKRPRNLRKSRRSTFVSMYHFLGVLLCFKSPSPWGRFPL